MYTEKDENMKWNSVIEWQLKNGSQKMVAQCTFLESALTNYSIDESILRVVKENSMTF